MHHLVDQEVKPMNTTLKGLITSFSKAVDVYNFLLKKHHRHVAVASYRIGQAYGLDEQSLSDLVISASLHDIGALYVEERNELIKMDVDNPYPHCRLGSYMLESFDPFKKISRILYYHHWPYHKNGLWVPEKGNIPIESYILHVADRIDILHNPEEPFYVQKNKIKDTIISYGGSLFEPEVTKAFEKIADEDSFWLDIENLEMEIVLEEAISKELEVDMSLELIEQFAFTISKIIDSRSKFTISHSFGVSEVAYRIAQLMGYQEEKCRKLRVAGLLHDMGKIAVPTEIIEKPDILTDAERADIKTHPYFTDLILKSIVGFEEIVEWA